MNDKIKGTLKMFIYYRQTRKYICIKRTSLLNGQLSLLKILHLQKGRGEKMQNFFQQNLIVSIIYLVELSNH